MNTPLELSEIGARLAKVDMLLMSIVKQRMDLALEVERRKSVGKTAEERKIFNFKREEERLMAVGDWAKEHGMNPHFAQTLLYLLIGESCKQQMIQLQNRAGKPTDDSGDESEWSETLCRNLLSLAESYSERYDVEYDKAFFATRAYVEFENNLLQEEIGKLSNHYVLLDLGCATGRLTFQLAERFQWAVGYDISPHMVEKANGKISNSGIRNICFKTADIEKGIPEPDSSVSLAVMNLGTASDMRDISKVLKEITRVLVSRGRFFLSFYNTEALLYRLDFIPWPTGLVAKVNIHNRCLDVQNGTKILSVYARSYSVSEVFDMIRGGIAVSRMETYPTISAILPNDLFENKPEVQKSIMAIDKQLANSPLNGGAYIVVTGQKVK